MADTSSPPRAGPSSEVGTTSPASTSPQPRPSPSSATPGDDGSRIAATAASAATSSRFSFPRASQPEIVRAYQKDVYYRDLFTSHLTDVVRGLVGTRTLHAHMDSIALVGSLAYFGLTSLGGSNQTLGEEYVNAMMVGRRGRIIRAKRRTAFILLHVLVPFLLTRLYTALRRTLARRATAQEQAEQRARMRARALRQAPPTSSRPVRAYRRLVALLAAKLPSMDTVTAQDGWLAYAGAAHLMLFYLGGKYYGVAQRVAGVSYISTIPQRPGAKPPSYEVLGVLLGIQLGVKLLLSINGYASERRRAAKNAATAAGSASGSASTSASSPTESKDTVQIDGRVYSHASSPAALLPTSAAPPRSSSQSHPSASAGGTVPLHYVDAGTLPPASLLSLPAGLSAEEVERAQAASKGLATELEQVASTVLRCTLCMDQRTPQCGNSAATECGHVFCWDCIVGWAREKHWQSAR
ncbi:related to PEX10 - peroxisomal assembly protein -peroxin [Pseudozyma flocculosa]|uniref:RING-type E3 ubiquitin transferase n=1 Tax=Pseudozyma flocculosa TaxID=84751 RepID=A0A5C3F2I9_9BASI|nr:related to PEX10 - peroxisomal assembly protein -peroxin [Pseudozyma flocculosa]